jgi:hypothetical protein
MCERDRIEEAIHISGIKGRYKIYDIFGNAAL